MAQTDSPLGEVREFYDFLGDVVPDQINATISTDATVATVPGGMGGIMKLFVNDGTGETAMAAGEVIYEASVGYISAEARIRVDALSNVAFSFGLTDAKTESAGTAVVSMGACDALTTTTSTGAGFAFSTAATNDVIFAWAVDGDSDHACAPANLTLAPVAATYRTYKVELHDQGCGNKARAEFYLCGEHKKTMTSAITRGTNLTWFANIQTLDNTCTGYIEIDYIDVRSSRGSSTA